MNNHLLLQKTGRIYLLIRYADRYHIVTVDRKLDEAKEAKLLSGDCSNAVLDELGLTRKTIPLSNVKSVFVGGRHAGAVIALHTDQKKLQYTLSDDYSQEAIDAVFSGIDRSRTAGRNAARSEASDWRTPMQSTGTRKLLMIIGIILHCIGVVCFGAAAFAKQMNLFWLILCLSVMVLSLGLYCLFPQYFSLLGTKANSRSGSSAKVVHLELPLLFPGAALTVHAFTHFYFPNWVPFLIIGGVLAIAVSSLLYLCSREVREHRVMLLSVALLCLIFSFGIVGQLNHFARSGASDSQLCQVIDTDVERNGRRADRYYCTILSDTGEALKLPISRSVYQQLQPGDTVEAFIGEGALGIDYAYWIGKK